MSQSAAITSLPLAPGEYVLDPSHTHVAFVGRHLMVTKVRGSFEKVEARISVGDSPEASRVEATIDVATLSTRDEKRDAHLRSPDFFDVERFPAITFRSSRIEPAGETRFAVTGDLTIRDQTHPITLNVEYGGTEATPWGTQAAAISASAEIDRERWGLTWNVALESGRFLVSKSIQLEIEAEIVAAPKPEAG